MTIESLTPTTAAPHIPQLIALLRNAVNNGASIGFLPPVSESEALAFWQNVCRELGTGKRRLLVGVEDGKIIGSVQLVLADQPNAKHRAEVQKLFVHTDYRGKGYGKTLLDAIEAQARKDKRTLLVLDSKVGDRAADLCERRGYALVGVIPHYSEQSDGTLADTAIFYRELNLVA